MDYRDIKFQLMSMILLSIAAFIFLEKREEAVNFGRKPELHANQPICVTTSLNYFINYLSGSPRALVHLSRGNFLD